MYSLVTILTKKNDSDPWVTPFTNSYFTQEELDTVVSDYIAISSGISGITNRTSTIDGNTMTISMNIDSLDTFNQIESASGNHAFVRLRNTKLRDLGIEQYTVVRRITQE